MYLKNCWADVLSKEWDAFVLSALAGPNAGIEAEGDELEFCKPIKGGILYRISSIAGFARLPNVSIAEGSAGVFRKSTSISTVEKTGRSCPVGEIDDLYVDLLALVLRQNTNHDR
jgi:hypothetical protein